MEVLRDDGRIQMRRCLEAMDGSTDAGERLALWKAAKRYYQRVKSERLTGLEGYSQALPHALRGGTACDGV